MEENRVEHARSEVILDIIEEWNMRRFGDFVKKLREMKEDESTIERYRVDYEKYLEWRRVLAKHFETNPTFSDELEYMPNNLWLQLVHASMQVIEIPSSLDAIAMAEGDIEDRIDMKLCGNNVN